MAGTILGRHHKRCANLWHQGKEKIAIYLVFGIKLSMIRSKCKVFLLQLIFLLEAISRLKTTKKFCDLVKINDLKPLLAFQLVLFFFVAFVLTILSDSIENFYLRRNELAGGSFSAFMPKKIIVAKINV